MITAETLWLRSQAAQQNLIQIANYNSALFGTAMVQAMQLSIAAPNAFWSAMMRVTAEPANDTVVPLAPKAAEKPKAKAKAAPKPKAAAPAPVAPVEAPKPVAAPKPKAKAVAEKAAAPVAVATAAPKPKKAAKPAPAPKPTPVAEVVAEKNPLLLDAPRGGKADDLTTLAGVGPKLATTLNEFGIYHYDQIAGLNEEGIDWLDEQQKGFKMLVARYDIVGQAKAVS